LATMASATLVATILGIIATFLIDDLGINRAQVGALIATSIVVAALASPVAGRFTDGLGGRRAVQLVFVTALAGLLGMAVSPIWGLMFLPVAISSFGQAAANPATNKLIAIHAPPGRRGFITGIKQSGVQAGIFVSGLVIPSVALALGWRWSLVLVASVPTLALVAGSVLLPADAPRGAGVAMRSPREKSGPGVRFLAVYGGLMGFGAAYTFLLPLFVEEGLGMSARLGGLAAGLVGLSAFFGRILWARFAEIRSRYSVALASIAILSLGAVVALYSSGSQTWLLWVGAVATGFSSSSWNSVGMLAVIHQAGPARAGRQSGIVMFGFLAGLGVAPPILGWTIDTFDTYRWVWIISLSALVAATTLSLWWLRGEAGRSSGRAEDQTREPDHGHSGAGRGEDAGDEGKAD